MRTGVSYMGQHDLPYLKRDLAEMRELRLDDVFVALQENDFYHFPGKIDLTPRVATENGIRTIDTFWGALNLFGGGRSSEFLLENPAGFQRSRNDTHLPSGCYMPSSAAKTAISIINPASTRRPSSEMRRKINDAEPTRHPHRSP